MKLEPSLASVVCQKETFKSEPTDRTVLVEQKTAAIVFSTTGNLISDAEINLKGLDKSEKRMAFFLFRCKTNSHTRVVL